MEPKRKFERVEFGRAHPSKVTPWGIRKRVEEIPLLNAALKNLMRDADVCADMSECRDKYGAFYPAKVQAEGRGMYYQTFKDRCYGEFLMTAYRKAYTAVKLGERSSFEQVMLACMTKELMLASIRREANRLDWNEMKIVPARYRKVS